MSKIYSLFIYLFLISSLIYCSSEDANRINIYDIKTSNVEDEAVISKDSFISQINTSILNYENTGVNFYIETDKSLTRSALNGEYEAQLILKTELTNKEIVETMLLYKFVDDENIVITHFVEDVVFATLFLNSNGQILGIDLSDEQLGTRSVKSWYNCVNGEYQKIKQRIEDDMLNDIVCTLLSVPCAIMNAASAIGKC